MRRIAVVLSLCLLSAFSVAAQTPPARPAPPLLYVHEEIARPSMIGQYESTSREFSALLKEVNPQFYFDVFSTDDFRYYYVVEMQNMADVDKTNAMFAEVAKKAGAKWADLMRRGGPTMDHTSEWVVRPRPDLSYAPAKPRLTETAAAAQRFDFYYIQPGNEGDVAAISNAWKNALGSKNLNNGYNLYEATMGGDLPVVIVEHWGASPADIAASEMDDMQKLGAELSGSLQTKTMAAVRRFEQHYARYRPDLSNSRPMPAAK